MSVIDELEAEVSALAGSMTVEVILLLIDKWEADMELAIRRNKASIPDLLNHYVRLKIMYHHIRKAWDRGWSSLSEEQFNTKAMDFHGRIKEARRNYYVAKQRYESKHGSGCPCRGCKCLAVVQQ
jgi:hypothetical protein